MRSYGFKIVVGALGVVLLGALSLAAFLIGVSIDHAYDARDSAEFWELLLHDRDAALNSIREIDVYYWPWQPAGTPWAEPMIYRLDDPEIIRDIFHADWSEPDFEGMIGWVELHIQTKHGTRPKVFIGNDPDVNWMPEMGHFGDPYATRSIPKVTAGTLIDWLASREDP